MKNIILIATCAAAMSAYALPTYEPFTEFATQIAAGGSNSINLATGGYSAPSGEQWGSLNFSGTFGSGLKGWDVLVTNNAATVFTSATLATLLPSGFPGAGQNIQISAFIPTNSTSGNYVGNSAVLKFTQDIPRPTSGTKTVFVSYLMNVLTTGNMGTGNNGRYAALLASTNLVEGVGTGGAYQTWASLFNQFTAPTPNYVSYGCKTKTANASYYVGPSDSSGGNNGSVSSLNSAINTADFVVTAYVLTAGGSIKDTNILWLNPATTSFGGPTPPAANVASLTMTTVMSDVGGFCLESRPGLNTSGGIGPTFIGNLLIGSTWSYVTGGPEFTTQPPANSAVNLGGSVTVSGIATAAGQSVTYQWQELVGATWMNLTDGTGTPGGGTAHVSNSGTSSVTLSSFSAGDVGSYRLVATASGTGFTLPSSTAALALADPQVTVNPAPAAANFNATATFTATVTTANPQLHYGWYLNGTPLQNGTLPGGSQTVAVNATGTTAGSSPFTITLTLNSADYLAAGSYYLVVTNSASFQATSASATLTVNDPYIVTQPANPSVAAGGTATFTVGAAGSPTLSYQWYEGTPPGGTQLMNGNTTASGATIGISSGSGTSTLTLGGSGAQDADNGSYYCAVSGSASLQTTNSAAATLVVQDPLTIVSPPVSRTERVGDHLAFTVGVTGGGPSYQWYAPNGSAISGATTSALVMTSIQTGSNGTYSVVVSNLLTSPKTNSATLTVINSTILDVSSANLVVARVGDGAQTLSGATGNTIYLDQYTTGGIYQNTIQVPDEAIGSPYPTGGASSLPGSPALLVAGGNVSPANDAFYEAMLTLSGVNQEYLCFAGYCQQYPYTGGSDVTVANLNTGWRGLATVNAFGVYSLAYTNYGLYSGGNHTIRSMVTLDGTNYWTTGQAGSGTVKYVNSTPGEIYASGSQVPSSTGVSGAGGQVVQIVNGALSGFLSGPNLVVSDAGQGANSGLYAANGTPEPVANNNVAFTALLYTGGGQPADFAFSPDNQTIYVAEAGVWTGTGPGTGGIERWDTNTTGTAGWLYSYTLPVLPGGTATNGAQGLTVDFSASPTWGSQVSGAIIYATSTGAAGNSLVQVVDNGNPNTTAPTITVLATAGPSQALRGVRFGPAAIAPAIASSPQSQTVPLGNSATFSVTATGSAPLFYQWYFGNTLLGGATQSSFTTNNVSYASAGSYSVVVSNLTTQTATSSAGVLTVTAGAPTITPVPLPSYTETAGDHLAWGPTITGSQPITNYWYRGSTLVQSNVTPPANGSLALANISTANNGTYTFVVSNLYGHASSSGSLTVTATHQNLSSANLVVARIGDGAQTLSAVTGNTLYLDQYTTGGTLVNTIQIPDEGTGQPYGTGSSDSTSMPFGSPALLFAGGNVSPGNDAGYEAFLTLAPNGQTLSFAGYCQAYPFAGPDVSFIAGGNGGTSWRGIATVDAYGYYTLVWTNTGLYSGGNHQVHSAVDIDGSSTNFYTTGEAGSGNAIKYCATSFQPANGMNIVYIAGSFSGTRVAQIIQGNLVFSDVGASPVGIYACQGLPTAAATAGLMIAEGNSPMDFASSTNLQTVYIADNGAFGGTNVQAGGIQRWDANGVGSLGFPTYGYSYTLGTGTGSTAGARGLTVDWSLFTGTGVGTSGEGAILYATIAEPSGNRLIRIVDNGPASSATVLALAGPNQIQAGVRFGPVIIPPSFATQPQNESAFTNSNSTVTFSAGAVGSGPLTYQWYFQAAGVGAFVAILNATNATYAISAAGNANVGNYYVKVTNPGGLAAQSDTVSFTLVLPPQFISETYLGQGNGVQLNFTGPAGYSYTLWSSTDVSLTPVRTTWSVLTTGTFTGGVDTFTDSSNNPQEFYIITVP